ncbi:MAG TPA: histidine kinase [Sphingobium sp.]
MIAARNASPDGGGVFSRARGWFGGRPLGIDPEWLICTGRLLAALFAALAIYLDPTRPARSLEDAHYVLGAYVVFSLIVTVFPPSKALASPIHLISHAIDILALGMLVYLTDELSSPFFPFLPFILLATTLRWGMRGAVIGAVVMQMILITIGWQDLSDGESELNILIMRSVYFVVAAAMLGYFGAYRERNSRRLAQLASWSFVPETTDRQTWLRDMLDHAADVLGAQRMVLVWKDREGRSTMAALRSGEKFQLVDLPDQAPWPDRPQSCAAAVQEILRWIDRTDILLDTDQPRCAPLTSARFTGCLYVIDALYRQEDMEPLAGIIALRIGHELERLALVQTIAGQARDQERVRLARDLHDSVLQDLAAGALRLKAIGSRLPPAAQESLRDITLVMAQQQRRIRLFVESTGAEAEAPGDVPLSTLAERIEDLEQQWGCAIALRISPADRTAPPAIVRELSQLLSEAVANAARHGEATALDVRLNEEEGMLRIAISDNGSGMTSPQEAPGCLPRSLSARVAMLNGHIAITRFSPGLALAIEVPLHETA